MKSLSTTPPLLRPILGLIVLLTLTASTARAQLPQIVQRYVDDTTLLVARVDISKLNVDATIDFINEMAGDLPAKDREQLIEEMRTGFTEMKQQFQPALEAGVSTGYVVVGPSSFTLGQPPLIVVPTENAQQAEQAAAVLAQEAGGSRVVDGGVLLGPAPVLDAAERTQPAPRPQFAEVLGEPGDDVVQVALVPTPLLKIMAGQAVAGLQEQMPQLPAQVAPAVQKLSSIGARLALPPSPNARVEMQFTDAQSAQAVAVAIKQGYEMARPELAENLDPQSAEKIFSAAAPQVEGNALTVGFDEEELRTTLAGPIMTALVQARKQAVMVHSMSNLRQIGLMINMYATEHDGALPPDLAALRQWAEASGTWAGAMEPLFTNPRTDAADGYVYVKPAEKLNDVKNTAQAVLMYEKLPADQLEGEEARVVVLFADGHAEAMPVERLRELSQAQGFEIERLEQ